MDTKTVCQILNPIRDLEEAITGGNAQWQRELARLIQEAGKPVAELTVAELTEISRRAHDNYMQLLEEQGAI